MRFLTVSRPERCSWHQLRVLAGSGRSVSSPWTRPRAEPCSQRYLVDSPPRRPSLDSTPPLPVRRTQTVQISCYSVLLNLSLSEADRELVFFFSLPDNPVEQLAAAAFLRHFYSLWVDEPLEGPIFSLETLNHCYVLTNFFWTERIEVFWTQAKDCLFSLFRGLPPEGWGPFFYPDIWSSSKKKQKTDAFIRTTGKIRRHETNISTTTTKTWRFSPSAPRRHLGVCSWTSSSPKACHCSLQNPRCPRLFSPIPIWSWGFWREEFLGWRQRGWDMDRSVDLCSVTFEEVIILFPILFYFMVKKTPKKQYKYSVPFLYRGSPFSTSLHRRFFF